jgi:hypothetical protein
MGTWAMNPVPVIQVWNVKAFTCHCQTMGVAHRSGTAFAHTLNVGGRLTLPPGMAIANGLSCCSEGSECSDLRASESTHRDPSALARPGCTHDRTSVH